MLGLIDLHPGESVGIPLPPSTRGLTCGLGYTAINPTCRHKRRTRFSWTG
jgi:hypothetical protein